MHLIDVCNTFQLKYALSWLRLFCVVACCKFFRIEDILSLISSFVSDVHWLLSRDGKMGQNLPTQSEPEKFWLEPKTG